ncbi:cobalt-precorrin 5A hydrolase [Sulfolobus sp. E5-1-F]|uniref:cobalt-precorrin 5A hydrolase n=1 Tax=Sulfolobaceae TaxID=118883 RepID=UPI0012958AD1|nr:MULTISPECIES: cobalt-precorrin 5A hydrolase [unclassified Sulfolobus]QGA53460.1 cobalt-precorrin 5A hydrolase [Sulfolobus sp. E5-1-F]QGA68863.1 cobalt-precorrin 5A hydrolase [Sulfolobus sp. E11-6]
MIENLWRGIAIISASEDGFNAGEIIKEKLKNFEIPVVHFKYKDANVETVWRCYDAIIFVMALEGATRIICKYAKSKTEDPAIICIDDKINYVIPLLGGHWGANDVARDLSIILNSTPIITTAAELKGKLSVERIANILVAKILNPENIVKINAALLRDEYVCLDGVDINVKFPDNIKVNSEECNYIISLNNNKEYKDKIVVWLKPLKISIGIGSKKDVKLDEIKNGVFNVLERLNLKRERIGIIASIREEVKKIADEFNVKFRLVNEEEINSFTNPCLTPPSKTLTQVGLKGVAEISALIAGGSNSKLILRKIAISRNSTIAVATYEGE